MVPSPLGDSRRRCVAIMGATSTGKSAAGIDLARRFGGEVVSMDSRQVYRGLDIGTGKVLPGERGGVIHHLIDVLDPVEVTSAGAHARRVARALEEIMARGRVPFLVGGTGLYFRAVLDGLVDVDIPAAAQTAIRARLERRGTRELFEALTARDPGRAARLSPNDRLRITRALEIIEYTGRPVSDLYREASGAMEIDTLKLVLTMPRGLLRERIAARTRAMFAAGWPGEVRRLLESGVPPDAPGMNSLGYGDIARAIAGGDDPDAVVERVITLTRQYAKRQETFFRGEADAVWIDVSEAGFPQRIREVVAGYLEPQ